MGNLLTAIHQLKDIGDPEVNEKFGIFLDFEGNDVKADPNNEFSVKLEEKIRASEEVLEHLRNYGAGGKKFIFDATANSSTEVQDATWAKMVPLIANLVECKNMADELNQLVPEILREMWTSRSGDSRTSNTVLDILKDHMFMMLQLGKILDIDMRFDALKMTAGSISNDISYVKRQFTLRQKSRTAVVEDRYASAINIQNLEALSMFYISGTPALNNIIEITTKFFKDAETKDEPLELIVSFSKICIKILGSDMRSNFQKFGTIGMVQRIMVATALLYDHLSINGVFVRDSPINIKSVVEILEEEAGVKRQRAKSKSTRPTPSTPASLAPTNSPGVTNRASYQELADQAKNLLSFLKYSSKHLRDPTTPKQVQQIFNNI